MVKLQYLIDESERERASTLDDVIQVSTLLNNSYRKLTKEWKL